MKIDPLFPSAPVLNPPKYKFKPQTSTAQKDPDHYFSDEVVVVKPADSWPLDVKVLLVFACIFTLGVLLI